VTVLHVRDFPDDLHRKLRVAAAARDETIRDIVIAAIGQELERRGDQEEAAEEAAEEEDTA
jgi:plasmid stability protein